MPCTRARSSHTRQRTSSYDEPSAARRPRRGRAHSSAPRGRRAPSLQSTLFIAAPQGHSGRNHSVWGTRAATRHRKRHPPSCVVDPPRASFRPAPLPTDLRPRILYRPPPRAGSYNLRSGSCTYLTPMGMCDGCGAQCHVSLACVPSIVVGCSVDPPRPGRRTWPSI